MVILTNSGFKALMRQIHRRLPKEGGRITGDLTIEKDFKVKGQSYEQLAFYPDMTITKEMEERECQRLA